MADKKGRKKLPQPTRKSKKRLLLLMVTVLVMFAGLSAKMAYVVFAQGEELQEKALLQQTKDSAVAAERGSILDRNGNVLAKSANAYTVVVRPEILEQGNVDSIISKLAQVLEMDEETVRKKATNTSKKEIWLARQIGDNAANELRKLSLPGVYFTVETKRYYPNSAFLTQTIGFTNVDGVGLEGIEAYYDEYLSGQPGRVVAETDVAGNAIPLAEQFYIAPENGYDVVLTADEVIQSFLEKSLQEAMDNENAKGAWGIVIDPDTGEILAMECLPDYDLNDIPNDDMATLTAQSRNSIITSEFEPGSMFEAITAASALDSGAVDANSVFDCKGYGMIQGQQIKCLAYPDSHGEQDIYEAAQNMCSSAFIEMGLSLGTQRFYDYLYDFGFGQPAGITFPADQDGNVTAEKYVQKSDLARMTVGQSIAVTPLQLISSVSAVVNGGFLFQPKIVRALQDSDGNIVKEYEPVAVSQPISETTSAAMRQLLEGVVSDGLGKGCYIPGYCVGGIAGISPKYDDDGNIIEGSHLDSFVGFAPADDPEIVVLIIVDEPDCPESFGITKAAPYVQSVLYESLQYLGEVQDETEAAQPTMADVPDITGRSLEEAKAALDTAGLRYIADGTGNIESQEPLAGEIVLKGSVVLLSMDTKPEKTDMEGMLIVPELIGLEVMQASEKLVDYDLKLVIQGSGTAVSQNPQAGTVVEEGTSITVQFASS